MTYVLRPGVLFLRYWPQLAACYLLGLLGLLGRRGVIELAAWRSPSGVSRRCTHRQHDSAIVGEAVDPLLAAVGDLQLRVRLLPHAQGDRLTGFHGILGMLQAKMSCSVRPRSEGLDQ